MKKRHSEFWRLRRKTPGLYQDGPAAQWFGVSPRTVRNWDTKGAPPWAMRLLFLKRGELAAIHPAYAGWHICHRGLLWGPGQRRLTVGHLMDWQKLFEDWRRDRGRLMVLERQPLYAWILSASKAFVRLRALTRRLSYWKKSLVSRST